jgi:O-methyltransferase involved in polyketide biosynthesis
MTDSPIFIIGTGRSGTTLLQLMLTAHPRILITFELGFYMVRRAMPRATTREFLDFYFQTHNFRWLGVDPARVLAALPDGLPPEQLGAAFVAIMREKAALHGKVRFGDKTPQHSAFLGPIFADFPDARVVHMTRDPRATTQSLAAMPWAAPTLLPNAYYCDLDRRWVAPYRDRVLQIRLEDLLAEPRATMARVLEHVGEPWDDAVLDHTSHLPAGTLMPPHPWLESAGRERRAGAARLDAMTPAALRLVERIAGGVMTDFGYDRAPLDREPGRLAVLGEALREIPATLRAFSLFGKMRPLMRDPSQFDQPTIPALLREMNPRAWARYPGFVWPVPPRAAPPPAAAPAPPPSRRSDLAPTALYTSATWSWARLPGAELLASRDADRVFAVTNAALRVARPTWARALPRGLVQRHLMIDRLVDGARSVLELAAGLSPRGVRISADPGVSYTEVDRAPVVARKRQLLVRTPEGRSALARPNLRLVAADLGDGPLEPLCPAPPEVVVAEGLFMYLDAPAQRALWRRVRALGPRRFVFDLVPAVEQEAPGVGGRALGWLFARATGGAAFARDRRTRADIAGELRDLGFAVALLEPRDVAGLPHAGEKTQVLLFDCRL